MNKKITILNDKEMNNNNNNNNNNEFKRFIKWNVW